VLEAVSAFEQLHCLLLPGGQLAHKLGLLGEREAAPTSGYGRGCPRL
jgi:hypothetical protein